MAKEIFSKDPEQFNVNLAEALKKIPEFVVPEWALYVKSGVSRQRPPVAADFWYTRAASILRQLYVRGVLGVGRMRTRYGSRKDRGGKPDKFVKSGGKIIRVILQQAEAAGLVEKVTRMQHGRRLTQSGRDLLDSIETKEKIGFTGEGVVIHQVEVEQEAIGEEETSVQVDQEAEVVEDAKNDGKDEIIEEAKVVDKDKSDTLKNTSEVVEDGE